MDSRIVVSVSLVVLVRALPFIEAGGYPYHRRYSGSYYNNRYRSHYRRNPSYRRNDNYKAPTKHEPEPYKPPYHGYAKEEPK